MEHRGLLTPAGSTGAATSRSEGLRAAFLQGSDRSGVMLYIYIGCVVS